MSTGVPCKMCGQMTMYLTDGRCPACERARKSAKRKPTKRTRQRALTRAEVLAALNSGKARLVRGRRP